MQVIKLTPGQPLWQELAAYARSCGWIAGPHLADMLCGNRFSDWEAPFAAVAEGRIVGFCTFLKTDYYPENRYWPWISSIYVDERCRGQRICGQLIAAACEHAAACGFPRVYIPSDMTGFYERYGFSHIDDLTNYAGDVDHVFARDLPQPGDVRLVRADAGDAEAIHRMKHEAFWPLYQRYHDDATSPALELLSKVKAQLAAPASDWWLIQHKGKTAGAMRIVRERTETGLPCCRISPLFILPPLQGQGVGQSALLAAFALYPEAAQWRLSTILQEHGNCHLYEKLCFRQTEVEASPYPGMDLAYYTRLREDVPMRRIARLTDHEVLGTEGLSHAAPRLTARAILRNPDGLYAVTHTEGFGIYMLPGGGVESGESILAALRRELAEETGCRAGAIEPLGYVEENRAHSDYTQLSFYFIVDTPDETLCPRLTEAETAHGATACWMTLADMWQHISAPVFDRPQGRFLQARDVAALQAYMALPARKDTP